MGIFFPKQFTVGVLSSFLRGVRPCVTGGVRLSGSVALFVSLHLSPFICLPSCVLLGSGVRLSGSVALFVSLHLSPFLCPSEWWCPPLWICRCICLPQFVSLHVSCWVVVSGSLDLSLYLSPFICLPSCVLLCGGVRLCGSIALYFA